MLLFVIVLTGFSTGTYIVGDKNKYLTLTELMMEQIAKAGIFSSVVFFFLFVCLQPCGCFL